MIFLNYKLIKFKLKKIKSLILNFLIHLNIKYLNGAFNQFILKLVFLSFFLL